MCKDAHVGEPGTPGLLKIGAIREPSYRGTRRRLVLAPIKLAEAAGGGTLSQAVDADRGDARRAAVAGA